MTKLYLITGFLGAGKTTCLKNLMGCFPGRNIALIVNEFGREGVDGARLSGLGAALTEIDNGSIFCSCRQEQFAAALGEVLARGPDVILVEASGLADPTGADKLLDRPDRFPGLSYAGAVCLVDAARFHQDFVSVRVCARQLAASGLALINKTDLAPAGEAARIREELLARCPGCQVHETTFGQVDPAWLAALEAPAPRAEDVSPAWDAPRARDVGLLKFTLVLDGGFTAAGLEEFLSLIAPDTYRIKGFAPLADGLFLVDCVGPQVRLTPWPGVAPNPGRLSVLFGAGQNARQSAQDAIDRHPRRGVSIE